MKAMRFIVVRFMPHVQTQEFANIGIVAACPKTGYFDYQITQQNQRLSLFFPHFENAVFQAATTAYGATLAQIKQHLQHATPDQIRAELDHLARPSETIIQTSEIGTSLAHSEPQELARLFDYYVAHRFATAQAA